MILAWSRKNVCSLWISIRCFLASDMFGNLTVHNWKIYVSQVTRRTSRLAVVLLFAQLSWKLIKYTFTYISWIYILNIYPEYRLLSYYILYSSLKTVQLFCLSTGYVVHRIVYSVHFLSYNIFDLSILTFNNFKFIPSVILFGQTCQA